MLTVGGAARDSAVKKLALRNEPLGTWSRLPWTCIWTVCLAALTLLVHTRALSSVDQTILKAVAATRPEEASAVMNWIFRFGFVQVDAVAAIIWAGALLARQASLSRRGTAKLLAAGKAASPPGVHRILRRVNTHAVLAPLLLFLVIAVQGGFRLVVDQPAPGSAYALHRQFAAQPVADVLDRTDAAARQGFLQATAPLATPEATQNAVERGSYPSGHSSRILFLGFLAVSYLIAAIGLKPVERRRASMWQAACVGGAATVAALVILVSYSAMYFGYHWPSDILGGFLLALAILPLALRSIQHPHLS